MKNYWLTLASIPKEGKEYFSDEQSFWEESIALYDLDCKIVDPIVTNIYILPQEEGILFRGHIKGSVSLPCDRCTEAALYALSEKFEAYEPLPKEALFIEEQDEVYDAHVLRMAAQGRGVEINPQALAWEEFVLALPPKPLCANKCKGLCTVCGANKNTQLCSCVKEELDPRLAPLQTLRVEIKK